MLILLVEDEPLTAALIMDAVEAVGHRVRVATTGATALRLVLDGNLRADMLVAESRLPDMPGWEVVTLCRHVRPGLPAIILSDTPAAGFRIANFVVTLQKPFSDEALLAALRAVMGGPTP